MSANLGQKLAKKLPTKRKNNLYNFPDPIPKGTILTDLAKKSWQVGTSIGKGGFGEIYSASEEGKHTDSSYAVKIEPHENGPLFVEMHFYMKICKSDEIDKWKKGKKLQSFGLPRFVGSGSHTINNKKYRFLMMERYGTDVWTIFLKNKKVFPYNTVLKLGIQILDVLEYIHSKGYIHADVKGTNLLLGLKKGSEGQVYLVDFGLTSRYDKDFKSDPKKAHNGTIEYTSRDAHQGVSTRRGDLEILAYNLLHWASSRLPWEDKLNSCLVVHQEKVKYMNDIPALMKKCFLKERTPDALYNYFKYVVSLAHHTEPDYDFCRKLFKEGLIACGSAVDGKLLFSSLPVSNSSAVRASPARRGKFVVQSTEEEQEDIIPGSPKKLKSPRSVKSSKKTRTVIPSTEKEEDVDSEVCVPKSIRAVKSRRGIPNGHQTKLDSSFEAEESSQSDEGYTLSSRGKKRGSDGFKESKGKKLKKRV